MNTICRSFATLVLPLAFVCLSTQLDAQVSSKKKTENSPVGSWNWERKSGDEMIKSQLTVTKKGDTYAGRVKDKDHDLTIKNSKFKDGTFSFEVSPHKENPEMTIQFSGKVSKGEIKGTMNYTVNGEEKSQEWNPKRSEPYAAVLGKWLLEFETPDGQQLSFTIEAKKKGKKLGLAFVDDDSAKFKNVKFKKGVLSFDTKQMYQDQPLNVEWDLEIDGDDLSGMLYYSFENDVAEAGEIEVMGERVK